MTAPLVVSPRSVVRPTCLGGWWLRSPSATPRRSDGDIAQGQDEPANSYERPRPGELVHIDVKKLGRIGRPGHRVNGDRRTQVRGIGWEFVHVAVDDATRLAYAEVLDDERGSTAAGFLRRAVSFFRRYGIRVERVLTDNGPCYRAIVHALTCKTLGIRHLRTRPYRPRTNGKACVSGLRCRPVGR